MAGTPFSTFTIDSDDPKISGEWYRRSDVDAAMEALREDAQMWREKANALNAMHSADHERIDQMTNALKNLQLANKVTVNDIREAMGLGPWEATP